MLAVELEALDQLLRPRAIPPWIEGGLEIDQLANRQRRVEMRLLRDVPDLAEDAGAPRVGQQLADEGDGLLRALPCPAPRRQLPHERAGPVADFHEPLCLEIPVGLNDGCGIDAQLSRELANGWQRSGAAQRAGCDRQAHALGDLHVERNGTAGIDPVKHATASRSSVLVQYNTCPTTRKRAPMWQI